MSNVYRIHGARFLRKYTAAEKSTNYAYMADVRKIANTLCKVPWTRVNGDVAATTTIHTEEGLDWNEPERDRFDAAEWCGEHSGGFHRAFAQASCYVFKLPPSAVGKAIEKIRVNVTSDPYNPYGARIAAMTSATLNIPMDCATVREGEVFRSPDENGMGAAPRLYRTNADGTQTWFANSEIVELVPGDTLTAKQYLFVFVALENYNRGRDGWIEGSSYIDNDVELTLSAAASDLVENELNDCSGVNKPSVLKLVNLKNGAIDGTINLSGEIHSMVELFLGEGREGAIAVVTGSFDESSINGFPGLVVYDYDSRQIVTVSEASGKEMPDSLKAAIRDGRAKLVYNLMNTLSLEFDYVPDSYLAESRLVFTLSDGVYSCMWFGGANATFNDSNVLAEKFVLESDTTGMIVRNNSIFVHGSEVVSLEKSGDISSVSGSISQGSQIVIAGKNKIDGNDSAVKFMTKFGEVGDDGLNLEPDNFDGFKAFDAFGLIGMGAAYRAMQRGWIVYVEGTGFPPLIEKSFDNGEFPMKNGKLLDACTFYDFTDGDVNPEEYANKVVTKDGYSGYCIWRGKSSFRLFVGADGISILRNSLKISGCPNFVFALCGKFKSIGGLQADGALIVSINADYSGVDGVYDYRCKTTFIPLELGEVRNMCIFATSSSKLPLGISHALVENY